MTVRSPELDALADAASSRFNRSRRFICRHVGVDASGAILCSIHPLIGVQCPACFHRHLQRHDEAEDFRCDRCGGVDKGIAAYAAEYFADVAVQQPRGAHGRFVGRVLVAGLGLCPGCVEQASIETSAA